MKADFVEHVCEKIIKSLMDVLILRVLEKEPTMGGYDFITFIHRKFGILISSGTVYSTLYSLERSGLIKGIWANRKRIYKLTVKGEEALQAVKKEKRKLQRLTARIF